LEDRPSFCDRAATVTGKNLERYEMAAAWKSDTLKRPREVLTEVVCPAGDGTGFQKVKQPTQPGRKIYPPKCAECLGKGRIKKPAAT
jgi:DnaJ-class molecular chaperone